MLHLETDIFPPLDVIENLLAKDKKVIGGLYDIDEGKYRFTMAQKHIYSAFHVISCVNFVTGDEISFVDGTIKPISSIGLGCVLIHNSVFKTIPFRFVKNKNVHPDSYFSEDCFTKKIKIYADTSIYCRHDNKAWGIYGLDFK